MNHLHTTSRFNNSLVRQAGMTLIEMVVVIIIMGILAVAAMYPMMTNTIDAYQLTSKQMASNGQMHFAMERMARELREELAIESVVGAFITGTCFEHGGRSYELKAYQVEWTGGEMEMRDHQELRWIDSEDFHKYDFKFFDIVFIATQIL